MKGEVRGKSAPGRAAKKISVLAGIGGKTGGAGGWACGEFAATIRDLAWKVGLDLAHITQSKWA